MNYTYLNNTKKVGNEWYEIEFNEFEYQELTEAIRKGRKKPDKVFKYGF